MLSRFVAATLVLWAMSFSGAETSESNDHSVLGLSPPDDTPIILAPNIISLPDQTELNAIFHPNGDEFYFCRQVDGIYRLFKMQRQENGTWSLPDRVALKAQDEYEIVDIWISPDGTKMIYISNAPTDIFAEGSVNFWVMNREGDSWGPPILLPAPINSDYREIYPVIVNSGNLYFGSNRPGGFGSFDLYVTRHHNGGYLPPENLGAPINSKNREGDVFVAPDESYLIAAISGREDSIGRSDLYISYRNEDGTWQGLVNLGPTVNTKNYDFTPVVSPDGQYLFYTSNGDMRWVSTRRILIRK